MVKAASNAVPAVICATSGRRARIGSHGGHTQASHLQMGTGVGGGVWSCDGSDTDHGFSRRRANAEVQKLLDLLNLCVSPGRRLIHNCTRRDNYVTPAVRETFQALPANIQNSEVTVSPQLSAIANM